MHKAFKQLGDKALKPLSRSGNLEIPKGAKLRSALMLIKKIAAMVVSSDHKNRGNKITNESPIYEMFILIFFFLFLGMMLQDKLLESKQHLSAVVASSHIQVLILFSLMIR